MASNLLGVSFSNHDKPFSKKSPRLEGQGRNANKRRPIIWLAPGALDRKLIKTTIPAPPKHCLLDTS